MRDDFCMFILTHGRADRIYTLKTLKQVGYTGKIYIIIDDEDESGDEYRKRYGDKVITFNKKERAKMTDTGDNLDGRNIVVFARNACFDIARELGIKYFMELDDDYTAFDYRFNKKGEFKHRHVKNLDKILELMVDFYEKSNTMNMAFAQGGDFIGGKEGMGKDIRMKRKAMNTMLCCVDREFQFMGRINEDVNAYVRLGQVGKLFLTLNAISINQHQTQAKAGGLTDIYLDLGTYVKSFYTILYCPSCVKISKMGNRMKRIHHKIFWDNAVPRIIDEKYKVTKNDKN